MGAYFFKAMVVFQGTHAFVAEFTAGIIIKRFMFNHPGKVLGISQCVKDNDRGVNRARNMNRGRIVGYEKVRQGNQT